MDFIDPGRNGVGMLAGRNSDKIVNLMPRTLTGARASRQDRYEQERPDNYVVALDQKLDFKVQ